TVEKFTPSGTWSVFATGLSDPMGLAFDGGGNLYVLNRGNRTIRQFSATGADFGVFASSGLNYPQSLAIDSLGNLYTANWGNGTIEKFTPHGSPSVFATTSLSSPQFIAIEIPDPSVSAM